MATRKTLAPRYERFVILGGLLALAALAWALVIGQALTLRDSAAAPGSMGMGAPLQWA